MHLSPSASANARTFLEHSARPLERALFHHHFDHASVATVLAELAAVRNPDGGFSLEPDVQSPVSSVLGTTVAFQILARLGVGAEEPLVRDGVRFLEATFDAATGVWPIVPPAVVAAPHAPWWDGADDSVTFALRWSGFRHNPRAEVIGHLLHWRAAVAPAFIDRVLAAFGWPDPVPGSQLEMHDLLCWVRLAQSPGLDPATRTRVVQRLAPLVDTGVSRDPAAWEKYGLTPLSVVKSPDSPLATVLGEAAIAANLDWLITRQGDDGAWRPTWNWGGRFPEAWQRSERVWSGMLTLDALLVLRAFGRW